MKSWKTTLGGSLSAAGSMMVGIGVVPQLGGTPNQFLTYTALAGFIMNVAGTFFGHLFAADQAELIRVSQVSGAPVPSSPPIIQSVQVDNTPKQP